MTRCTPAALLVFATLSAATAANAAFISFDERPRDPPGDVEGDWAADPLGSKEYQSLGVSFREAYLQPKGSSPVYSKSQYLLGGNGFGISFTDAAHLPTHVSLSFSAPWSGFAATVGAVDGLGRYLGSFSTGGDYWAGPDLGWVHTHYTPHSFASFSSEAGIGGLIFNTEGGDRIIGMIDNLYFGNVAAVPEPSTLAMWASGLGVLWAARRRKATGQGAAT